MSITVATWNLNHWQGDSARRSAAWDYLRDEIGVDVALVQEAGPAPESWHCVGAEATDDARAWRTAVASPSHPLIEVTTTRPVRTSADVALDNSLPGTAAFATATIAGRSLTVASLYGLMNPRNAYTAVNRHLADLSLLMESTAHYQQAVVAGDLNLTTQWHGRAAAYAPIDRALLQQFRAWGLHDLLAHSLATERLADCPCDEGEACRHVETWFPRKRTWPHQNDYAFVSTGLNASVQVRVDTAPVDEGLSDHAAIVLTIA